MPVPEVLLHPSVAERFTRCAPGMSGAARRTLRTNLRFIGRRVVPHLYPADLPLPRERARQPYGRRRRSPGSSSLADAQPTAARRMRAAGLVCLGAGAGLIRGDLRGVRGSDVALPLRRRDRAGPRDRVPRTVPVLSRYQGRLLAAARVRRDRPGLRRAEGPGRRNITNPLVAALDGGGGLPRLDTSRLRATWLADCGEPARAWPRSWRAAGISCCQRLGDLVAGLEPGGESRGGPAAGGRPAMIPLAAARRRHRRLRRRPADRGTCCPSGARRRGSWPSAPCWRA